MSSFDVSRLGLFIEQQQFNSEQSPTPAINGVHIFKAGEYECEPAARLSTKTDLAPVTNFGNRLTLYQVTLCYKTVNLFGSLVGKRWEMTSSTSLSVGR